MTIAITLFLAALLQHSGFAQAMVTFYANGVFELVTAFSGLYFTYQDTNWGWRWVFFLSHSYQTWPALMTIQFADFVVDCASKPTNRFDCLLAANGNELLNQFDLVPAGAWAGLANAVLLLICRWALYVLLAWAALEANARKLSVRGLLRPLLARFKSVSTSLHVHVHVGASSVQLEVDGASSRRTSSVRSDKHGRSALFQSVLPVELLVSLY